MFTMKNRPYYVLSPDPELPFIYGDVTFSPIDQGVYSNLWDDRILPDNLFAKAKLTKPKRVISRDLLSLNAGFVGRNNITSILIDKKLNTLLRPHPCDIFYHDDMKVDGDFSFLEFRCFVDAFDYINSEYTTSIGLDRYDGSGTIKTCRKLVIDENKTNQLDLFFLKNFDFFNPIITHNLFRALVDKKIKGIKITPVEQFSWSE